MGDTRLMLALMAGLPGAGKTTLSIELGRELGWHVIDKDSRKIMHLKEGWEDYDAARAAYKWSFDTAHEILACQRSSVILDTATLHTFVLEQAREMILSMEDVQLKIILCVADRDLRNSRLRTRERITAIRVDPETIGDYFQHFKHLPPEPERLTLYTNRSLQECLVKAVEYLTN